MNTSERRYFKILAGVLIGVSMLVLMPIRVPAQQMSEVKSGGIKGRIIAQATKEPVSGVSVMVKEKRVTVVSDSSGSFIINGIDAGTYTLVLSHVGFQERLMNDIPIIHGKVYYLEAELLNDDRQLNVVTVKAFRGEHNPMVPVSSYSFSREEIFRSPGAQG